MHDVARLAGVSQSSVSLVLNDPENCGIPVATQERIHEAIRQVGYRTNRLARAMRLHRTDTIGFVSDDIATTPFANQMIKGAQDAAWEAGRLLLIVNTGAVDHPEHAELESAAIDQLLERQVDGIVLAAMFHRVLSPPPALRETRAVLLDARVADESLPSVVPDEHGAAFAATDYLIRYGHRRVGFVTTDYPSAAPPARLQGYRDALGAHSIAFDDDLVAVGVSSTSGGRAAVGDLLDLDDPPTAIFCYNDQTAMGVYQTARDRGLRIPEDLSLVGFDDQQLIAAELVPPLTTMALPHYAMGHWAVSYLLTDDPPDEPAQMVLECPLIERGSVTEPPARPRGSARLS